MDQWNDGIIAKKKNKKYYHCGPDLLIRLWLMVNSDQVDRIATKMSEEIFSAYPNK